MATLLKIIFLGTGTSGGIPNISCLTEPEKDCSVCQSSVTVAGKKNRRRNTSLIVQFKPHSDPPTARPRNVLIDCGKTFYESTLEFFPQYGLRELDGVILTHGHADAVFGLDDLRQWTLHGAVQTKIDIYLCSDTMSTVSTTFPYLVDSQKATGGGDVASFQYHIINANQNFTIHGLNFTPLVVHHGIYFTTHLPYHCYGFHFGGVSYFSDTNYIPPETMERIKGKTQVLVLDCLYEGETHASHFALKDSLGAAEEIKALKTYLVGFAHRLDHYELEKRLLPMAQEHQLQVAPAFDGLCITLQDKVTIIESSFLDTSPTVIRPVQRPQAE